MDMPITQLIYASRPFGYDDLDLLTILSSARRNNVRDGITGALICREDLYMQLLEGREAQVQAAYRRIEADSRHTEVRLLCSDEMETRLFPQWAMRHDPARSWMWSREEVSAGAAERATADQARAIFARLAILPPETAQTCPMGHGA
jgi:hypothetical protein